MKSNTNINKIDDAMSELCSLFDSGELRASVDMAGFLVDIATEIKTLRELLTDAVELAGVGCIPTKRRLDDWTDVLCGDSE